MIDQVPPELAELIAAEAEAPAGDAAARAAIHSRVVASAGAVATGKLLALILGIGVVVTGTVAVVAWPRGHENRAEVHNAPAVVAPAPAPAPVPTPSKAAAMAPTPVPPTVTLPSPSTSPRRTREVADIIAPATPPPAQAPPPPTAAAAPAPPSEVALLSDASHALADGDATKALSLVDRHAQLYPAGQLAEERDALQARALAAAGRVDDAHAAAEKFRAAYPHSVYLHALMKDVAP